MSNERFIKFIDSDESQYLQKHFPNAFLLLCLIARRARRIANQPDGLEIGEAHIGDFKNAGIESERQYRTAKKVLIERAHISVVETCRKFVKKNIVEKSTTKETTKTTTYGTLVKILKSDIWDVNIKLNDDQNDDKSDDQATTNRRGTRKNKKSIDIISLSEENLILRKPEVKTSDIDHQRLLAKHSAEDIEAAYEILSEWKQRATEKGKNKATDIGRMEKWAINQARDNRIKKEELDLREADLKQKKEYKWTQQNKKSHSYRMQNLNVSSSKDKEPYLENDTSGHLLAEFARQTGLQ